jgi:hypothetical protein
MSGPPDHAGAQLKMAPPPWREDRARWKKLARSGVVPAASAARELEWGAEVIWSAALNASIITWNAFRQQAQAEFSEFFEHNGNFH